jgi:hypothetical protein
VCQPDLLPAERDVEMSPVRVSTVFAVDVSEEREPECLSPREDAEPQHDEYDGDDDLERRGDRVRDAEVQREKDRSQEEDGEGVAEPPGDSRRDWSSFVLDERRDGRDVIGFERVPGTEDAPDEYPRADCPEEK